MKQPIRILFVCTGNACRSQMAEGWTRELAKQYRVPGFEAASAGLEAHGLDSRAVAVMAAMQVDIAKQTSKLLTPALIQAADVIVTVCSHADENCPVVPPHIRKIHLPFEDPARASGSEARVAEVFASVCLQIRDKLVGLLAQLSEEYHSAAVLDSWFDHDDVRILSRKTAWKGFIPVEVLQLKHRLYRGGWSAELQRELVTRPRAVGALLYDPFADKVVMLRQFRTGLVDESESPWLLEIVAGLAASGEATNDVVKREALEETNCRIDRILPICEYFNSPGWSNERVSLFCAQVDASVANGVHGLDEEHEDILVVVLALDEAIAAVRKGGINNAMSVIAIQWLELNRDSVRIQWTGTENRS